MTLTFIKKTKAETQVLIIWKARFEFIPQKSSYKRESGREFRYSLFVAEQGHRKYN